MPARRQPKTAKVARAKSRVAARRSGTVTGRSRKKQRRTAPDRIAPVEKVMGLPVLPERGLDPTR